MAKQQTPKLQNTSSTDTRIPIKGMTKDLNTALVGKENYTHAINAINKGLDKGDLKNPGFALLTLGQALFELQRFNEARDVFTKASQSERDAVKKSARAWLKYTDNEQERVKNLNLRKESIS